MSSRTKVADIKNQNFPALPLRDIVVFPNMVVPLFVGREKSIKALEEVMKTNKQVFLVSQKQASVDDPQNKDVYTIGALSSILQLLKLPDGTVKVLAEGSTRAKINSFVDNPNYLEVNVSTINDKGFKTNDLRPLAKAVTSQFEQYVKLSKKIPYEVVSSVSEIEDYAVLSDTLAAHVVAKIDEKQKILEMNSVKSRLERIGELMESDIASLQVEKKIRGRVKRQMEKTQKEYYLNEQMKAIQKELGEGDDGSNELQELENSIKKATMTKEAKEKSLSELKKLKSMSPMSAEATVVRNYLDWMVSIPWDKRSKIKTTISSAKKILDEDHYGLDKVKERILEYLAVQNRIVKMKGPILCFVGAPGVGKTSLGKSIARSTGRKFVRMSLGGVRDEAEIRGHRRTYIGSMPGKVMQMMKKAQTKNPLILFDEVDKIGIDWRGDPASALLEILDPEQNSAFNDHYLEVDYDLSEVMFITTANTTRIPPALLDRMEIIRLPGYTEPEKIEIARRHLVEKQMKSHGLKNKEWSISDNAIRDIIRYYTREAGVRNLEREIANLTRKAVKSIEFEKKIKSVKVTDKNLSNFSGVRKFRYGEVEEIDRVGLVTGLAWTEVGGELLNIEAAIMPGKGKMLITGKLGEVMQESVQAAQSYVRARCVSFGIEPPIFGKKDIHVHVPEGATPKDGPSAGVGMITSMISVLTGIPVKRDIAMTGEITLRGSILPIGGLKEKLLAALRGGIKTVLIPKENKKDLSEIPANIKSDLKIVPVDSVDQVLKLALTKPLVPIEWDESKEAKSIPSKKSKKSRDSLVTH